MGGFLRIELIKSLVFPGLCALWVIVRFFDELSYGADFTADYCCRPVSYIAAVIFGCVIPVLLTLKKEIHTESYLVKRLIMLVVMYVWFGVIGKMGYPLPMLTAYLLFGLASVIFQLCKFQKEDTPAAERAVLMLSDPVIYWTVFNVLQEWSVYMRWTGP